MMIWLNKCCIIIIVLSSVGCSSLNKSYSAKVSDLVLDLNNKIKTEGQLASEQIDQDVSILIYALRKAYGGSVVHSRNLLKGVETELQKINGPMSAEHFCESVAKTLFLIPDGHVNIALNNKSCAKLSCPGNPRTKWFGV